MTWSSGSPSPRAAAAVFVASAAPPPLRFPSVTSIRSNCWSCCARAIMRRTRPTAPTNENRRSTFDAFIIDIDARSLSRQDGAAVTLTSAEFDLLTCFVQRPRRVLTRDQILDWTHGRAADPFDRTVDMLISRLRKKLDAANPGCNLITTVRNGAAAMMLRLSFAARIGLIIFVGIGAAWILALTLFHVSRAHSDGDVLPLPRRIVALVEAAVDRVECQATGYLQQAALVHSGVGAQTCDQTRGLALQPRRSLLDGAIQQGRSEAAADSDQTPVMQFGEATGGVVETLLGQGDQFLRPGRQAACDGTEANPAILQQAGARAIQTALQICDQGAQV
eukprot:gene2131-2867_t